MLSWWKLVDTYALGAYVNSCGFESHREHCVRSVMVNMEGCGPSDVGPIPTVHPNPL